MRRSRHIFAVAGLLALLGPFAALGQLVAIGEPFQVNTDTSGVHDRPQVVALSDGGFMVLWSTVYDQPHSSSALYGRRFDSSGQPAADPVAIDPVVGSPPAAVKEDHLVLADGRRVVGGEYKLGVATFGLDGSPETFFPSDADDYSYPSLAVTPQGETILAWDPSFEPIRLQRFRTDGAVAGPSFVTGGTDGYYDYPHSPKVATGSDGSMVVVWWDEGPGTIFGQRFGADDVSIGQQFVVAADDDIMYGGIAYDLCVDQESGEFTVAWADAAFQYTRISRFSAEPRLLGKTQCGALISYPTVTCASGGRFLVTGLAFDGSEPAIAVRAFDGDFHILGTTLIPVPNHYGLFRNSRGIDLAVLSDGDSNLAIAWNQCVDEQRTDCDIFAQRISFSSESECAGDCNGDGVVSVDELITAIDLGIKGEAAVNRCPTLDVEADCRVSIDEIVTAVDHSLNGCH